jgi:predicted nucleic acid-binding protein
MLRYLLDTNLYIRVLRDRPTTGRDRFNNDADSLCISTIVLMELLHGAAKSARACSKQARSRRLRGTIGSIAVRYRRGWSHCRNTRQS